MGEHILGAILAGGQSRRFGSDKAVAVWRGARLIDHVHAALSDFADEVIVCGRDGGVADRPEGGRGPLAGLNAALHWGAAHGFDRVLSIGCDTPQVPPALLAQLIASKGPAFAMECPIIGCWPVGLAASLDHFLATDAKCSLKGWAAFTGAHGIASAPILNVNAPADLETAS